MKKYTITITKVIATSGRYNRIAFDVIDANGKTLTVVYPSGRGQDDESLAVDSSIFAIASMAYNTGKNAEAELYVNRCCCCSDTKIMVEGIYSLTLPSSGNG